MVHLTLNSRHSCQASTLLPGTREALLPLVRAGRGVVPGGLGLTVEIVGTPDLAVFTIYRDAVPVSTSIVVRLANDRVHIHAFCVSYPRHSYV